jgi:hypothetical protein
MRRHLLILVAATLIVACGTGTGPTSAPSTSPLQPPTPAPAPAPSSTQTPAVTSPIGTLSPADTVALLDCGPDDDELVRVVIADTPGNPSGHITLSACGYPESEYGPVVVHVTTGTAPVPVIVEADQLWVTNEVTVAANPDGTWTFPATAENPYDGPAVLVTVAADGSGYTTTADPSSP